MATTMSIAAAEARELQPGQNRVTFPSDGVPLVGDLYLPESYRSGEKLPVIVVTGSWTTVKEQMAGVYARRLAEHGFAALAFDFRNFGESGGEPRQYESPELKMRDIENAIAFVRSLPVSDGEAVGALGVCAGAGYMAHAVARGAPIQSLGLVAAWQIGRAHV